MYVTMQCSKRMILFRTIYCLLLVGIIFSLFVEWKRLPDEVSGYFKGFREKYVSLNDKYSENRTIKEIEIKPQNPKKKAPQNSTNKKPRNSKKKKSQNSKEGKILDGLDNLIKPEKKGNCNGWVF